MNNLLDNLELAAKILGILGVFSALIVKWARDRKDLADTKKSQVETTATLKVLTRDLQETKADTKEGNRLLAAVHKRLDRVERDVRRTRIQQVRLEEKHEALRDQVKSLRDTQRIRPIE